MEFLRKYKYLAAFVSALFLDVWFDMCAYSAAHSAYALGMFANFTYPLISMVPIILVVEETELKNKVKVALVEGAGYAVGTAVFMTVRDYLVRVG